jgi:hypothetical protein
MSMDNPYAPPGQIPPPPGGWGPPGYGGPPQTAGDYEFDAEENRVIGSAAMWARVLGVVLIIVGASALLNCNVISTALNVAVAIFLLGGGNSLARVVTTEGNDIGNMMMALSKLGTAFKIRVIASIIAAALVLGILLIVGLVLAARSSR